MQEETKPAVSRRGLLRRAGTVAAGAGAVGVAAAVAGSPAHATNGQALTHGGTFDAPASKTTINGGDAANPTLKLANPSAAGVPLELKPSTNAVNIASVPPGSTYVDPFGDVHVIAEVDDEGELVRWDNMSYSPTWATMTVPVPPKTLVHTWVGSGPAGRAHVVPGSASYDGFGRVLPKFNSGPDLVIDLSDYILPFGGIAAVQANLTIEAGQLVPSSGVTAPWAALWGEGNWPGNTSVSFQFGDHATSSFTQTTIGADGTIRLKLYARAVVIFNVVGFVVNDPFVQAPWLIGGSWPNPGAQASAAGPTGRKPAARRG